MVRAASRLEFLFVFAQKRAGPRGPHNPAGMGRRGTAQDKRSAAGPGALRPARRPGREKARRARGDGGV